MLIKLDTTSDNGYKLYSEIFQDTIKGHLESNKEEKNGN